MYCKICCKDIEQDAKCNICENNKINAKRTIITRYCRDDNIPSMMKEIDNFIVEYWYNYYDRDHPKRYKLNNPGSLNYTGHRQHMPDEMVWNINRDTFIESHIKPIIDKIS